jgi:hypothetical protein
MAAIVVMILDFIVSELFDIYRIFFFLYV